MAAFPLRAVFMRVDKTESSKPLPPASILISVPKKRFKHAVDRNRVKRLVRECYRTNKHLIWNALEGKDYTMVVAFVCITDTLPSYRMMRKSVIKILTRISEHID